MSMKRIVPALALLGSMVAFGGTECVAQYQTTPAGAVSTCDYTGTATLTGRMFQGGRETISLNGAVSFQTISTSGQTNATAWENLLPTAFSGSGASSTVGLISFTLDPTRTPPVSSIVANQQGAPLPATGTLSFYITATMAALPGVVYESIQPVTELGNVTVWPHFNTPYNQSNTVDFQNRAQPGVVSFSIAPWGAPVSVTARN